MASVVGGTSAYLLSRISERSMATPASAGVEVRSPYAFEDLFGYIERSGGAFDTTHYRRLLGAGNEFKEGDQSQGLAAADQGSRENARALLARTRIGDLLAHPVFEDAVSAYIRSAVDPVSSKKLAPWTFDDLKQFLLSSTEDEIKQIMPGLHSDVIACVVRLMSNQELIQVGANIFNTLPGSQIGARGYMGARIQPNSPTDNVDDIRWQVFNGFAFAVGDVVLGTNPVSSDVASVAAVELALADVLEAFGIADVMPHCVLAHIDVQSAAEASHPGATALWFQSLAGVEDANATFDISVEKMIRHAQSRHGKYGLYFETGQGADATNGHGKGFDMVLHEARKYGFARALRQEVAQAQKMAGRASLPWVHVNDVAGFIGPEVFRSREQLVRCCLEDIVMGKLHGLTIGLDICSTLHMDIDLDDLDWCIEQIMPACPAYLMALPTKNDPMLSYLTTAFQDHVRVRERFGYRVNDQMWKFYQQLGVIDTAGRPTEHFGQPLWVYLHYCRRKQDTRPDAEIFAEGRRQIAQVRERGIFVAEGYGARPWQLQPSLDQQIRHLFADSKECIWAELPVGFVAEIPHAVPVQSQVADRRDYILHPPAGEVLDSPSVEAIKRLRDAQASTYHVQIVVSDGLNAYALTDEGHLAPYLQGVRGALADVGLHAAPEHIVVRGGRVRAGYRIGELLYGRPIGDDDSYRTILHVIGERPGSGHHAFSVYITTARANVWAEAGRADHNITRVVSGIADTALPPLQAAEETARIVRQIIATSAPN
jgi:ethanolamine ammonia-lyase large subunit